MKIDAVLARHPWPWRMSYGTNNEWWEVLDAKGCTMFDDGSSAGDCEGVATEAVGYAILELVEAHVAAAGRSSKESKEDKQ